MTQPSLDIEGTDTTPQSAAVLSVCGKYRYLLSRVWDKSLPRVLWIMLNPSTADASSDDPTIRRCVNFARDWAYGGIEVVNLFAYRATDPKDLKIPSDPVGPENFAHVLRACHRTRGGGGVIVCAWGNGGSYLGMGDTVADMLRTEMPGRYAYTLHCLKLGKTGVPYHPLYLPAVLKPVPFVRDSKNGK